MNKSPLLLASILLAGCLSSKSPYDNLENWLIREDPVRPFSIAADIIYVQNDLYVDMNNVAAMYSYAKDAVGNGKFDGLARVFSPLVAMPEDVEKAVKWYLDKHHTGKRPFVFIGEGVGGALLKAYEEENEVWLLKRGLVAKFYTEKPYKGFVSEDMLREIRNAVAIARYRAQWGRDMPADMLKGDSAEHTGQQQ